jgi:hypothetical protein
MHKNATKCNKTQSKWCINKHGASKIIDTFETYQPPASACTLRSRNCSRRGWLWGNAQLGRFSRACPRGALSSVRDTTQGWPRNPINGLLALQGLVGLFAGYQPLLLWQLPWGWRWWPPHLPKVVIRLVASLLQAARLVVVDLRISH